ncbi:CopY/TcrY family copper transport repressor [Streptococcus suis]|uniref:CopY/TcrY family copper transport repressor n=1 Tax=Streptococcus suis TaxID=1307 RepID=UPI00137A88C8|nr:CopY/TcrY family copper transport repressor [Streptococcus suis]MBS0687117.1 CopY/TcrY family copper transport repressor [Streptococcus suis]MBS0713960.1 CopY/TcrY family copper transport repressor [Streptococcus suis]HEL2220400.1 CopY/TcrY family copper transport repressor [Streptococcus suis]HEL9628751.1 CopY/TcrY family copper transport repressor [Streptococcus suis]
MEQTISAAEWQVMRVLWAQPGATSQEIIRALQEGFDWQATTIKTLLGRLRKKDYLRMVKEASKYHYYPLISEEEHLQGQVELLLAIICSTKQGQVVENLLDTGIFSKKTLEKLAIKIRQLQESAPEHVVCQCLAGQCTCGHHKKGELR